MLDTIILLSLFSSLFKNEVIEVKHDYLDNQIQISINNLDKEYDEYQEYLRLHTFNGETDTEIAEKLDRYLNSTLEGKGQFIAEYSISVGMDPYLATAVMLQETGCYWTCSYLTRVCNNVGGQKGSPSCNGGSYRRFDTLEEGLGQLAKKLDNCFALIKDDPNDTRRVILIFPAGCVSKRTVALGKKWTIRNFANLLSEPAIDDNCIKLSFIMEPRMLVNDYITLTIDDEIGRSGASFNLTSGAAYDQKMFTSTGMTGGAVGSVNTYNKNSAKKYGNIFFKWYFIWDIEHTGSTHDSRWETNVCCNGGGMLNE